MQLPLDFGRRPFREKYLDETPQFALWYVFGRRTRGKEELVDIQCCQQDVLIAVPPDIAAELVRQHNAFIAFLQGFLVEEPKG